jgi:hypothetical protein
VLFLLARAGGVWWLLSRFWVVFGAGPWLQMSERAGCKASDFKGDDGWSLRSVLPHGGRSVSRPGSGSSMRLIGGVVGGRMAFELGSVMEPDSRRFVAFTSTLVEARFDEEVRDIEL